MNERKSGSKERYPFQITGTHLVSELISIAQKHDVPNAIVVGRFLRTVLIAKNAYEKNMGDLVVRDSEGFETRLLTMLDGKIQQSNEDPGIKIRKTFSFWPLEIKLSRTMQGVAGGYLPASVHDELAELANIYHSSVERTLTGIIGLGLDLSRREMQDEVTLILRNEQDEETYIEISNFNDS